MRIDKDKVSILMAEKGWNQQRLSDEAGKSRSNISMLINGRSTRAATIKPIADALGVKIQDILED